MPRHVESTAVGRRSRRRANCRWRCEVSFWRGLAKRVSNDHPAAVTTLSLEIHFGVDLATSDVVDVLQAALVDISPRFCETLRVTGSTCSVRRTSN